MIRTFEIDVVVPDAPLTQREDDFVDALIELAHEHGFSVEGVSSGSHMLRNQDGAT